MPAHICLLIQIWWWWRAKPIWLFFGCWLIKMTIRLILVTISTGINSWCPWSIFLCIDIGIIRWNRLLIIRSNLRVSLSLYGVIIIVPNRSLSRREYFTLLLLSVWHASLSLTMTISLSWASLSRLWVIYVTFWRNHYGASQTLITTFLSKRWTLLRVFPLTHIVSGVRKIRKDCI